MASKTDVPDDVAAAVLVASAHTCCKCRQPHLLIEIHHIDGDHENHEPSNLAVLCKQCHGETLVKGGFGRTLTPDQVRKYRDEWIDICVGRGASAAPPVAAAAPIKVKLAPVLDLTYRLLELIERGPDEAIQAYDENERVFGQVRGGLAVEAGGMGLLDEMRRVRQAISLYQGSWTIQLAVQPQDPAKAADHAVKLDERRDNARQSIVDLQLGALGMIPLDKDGPTTQVKAALRGVVVELSNTIRVLAMSVKNQSVLAIPTADAIYKTYMRDLVEGLPDGLLEELNVAYADVLLLRRRIEEAEREALESGEAGLSPGSLTVFRHILQDLEAARDHLRAHLSSL